MTTQELQQATALLRAGGGTVPSWSDAEAFAVAACAAGWLGFDVGQEFRAACAYIDAGTTGAGLFGMEADVSNRAFYVGGLEAANAATDADAAASVDQLTADLNAAKQASGPVAETPALDQAAAAAQQQQAAAAAAQQQQAAAAAAAGTVPQQPQDAAAQGNASAVAGLSTPENVANTVAVADRLTRLIEVSRPFAGGATDEQIQKHYIQSMGLQSWETMPADQCELKIAAMEAKLAQGSQQQQTPQQPAQ